MSKRVKMEKDKKSLVGNLLREASFLCLSKKSRLLSLQGILFFDTSYLLDLLHQVRNFIYFIEEKR